ncbi:MAG: hypothetical protein QXN55_01345 [Candidatus Nitrosotenuis sp.]
MLPINVYPPDQLEIMREKARNLSVKLSTAPVEKVDTYKGYSTLMDIKAGKNVIGKIVGYDDGRFSFLTLLETRGRTHHSFTLSTFIHQDLEVVIEVAKVVAAFKHVERRHFLKSVHDIMSQRAKSDFSENLDKVILKEAIEEFAGQSAQ